jgi:hypothetical protein
LTKALKQVPTDLITNAKYFVEMPTIYLWLLKKYPSLILADYLVAVRISTSAAAKPGKSSFVFRYSPARSWYELINRLLPEKKYASFRSYFNKFFVGGNYVGLVQLKNYGGQAKLIRELRFMLKIRPDNYWQVRFIVYNLICLLFPQDWLIGLTNWYKRSILQKSIPKINFVYDIS